MDARIVVDGGEVEVILKPQSDLEKWLFNEMLQGKYEMHLPCRFSIKETGDDPEFQLTFIQ